MFVAGVVVVPLALILSVFNSWGPLTEESAVRMAFAQVAGGPVAILSALAFVVLTIRRGVDWAATAGALLVAALVISWSAAAIDRAAGRPGRSDRHRPERVAAGGLTSTERNRKPHISRGFHGGDGGI
ncbi:hypothetical protein [Microbacterium sp. MM2322]|uniref:hypothetical protein n=1 Tax=Microbacterium sp. MM2322 TaxID=3157631 RepID=UPI0032D59E45